MSQQPTRVLERTVRAAVLWTVAGTAFGATSSSAPTFARDVAPILQKHCQACHRPGEIGPMSLLTYEEVRPWAKAMKAAVVRRTMPPWHADPAHGNFENDRTLSADDIQTITAWADAGAVSGDLAAAPKPIHFE